MLKRLAILAVAGALLLGWPSVAQQNLGTSHATAHDSDKNQKPSPPTPPIINPSIATPCEQATPRYTQENAPEKPLPRPLRPEWVIVYITTIYVLLTWRTLLTIKRQADTMETQAKDARESVTQTLAILKEQTDNALISAKAATVSARAANDQIQMMKGRERARISVSVSDEEFEVESQAFNAITIKITNDGPTSAFNISAIGEALGQQGQALPFMGCQIPLKTRSVISANNEPIPTEVVFVSHHDLRNIHESPIPYFFHVAGEVNYEDVFGERRKTTFRYRLQVMAVRTSAETKRVKIRSILGWRKCGTPEENKPT